MRTIALLGALVMAVLAAALVRGSGPEPSEASSHREAPVISEDPTADNTDVYAFVSPDRPNTVTIVANYIPLEEPAGGPNFNEFAARSRSTVSASASRSSSHSASAWPRRSRRSGCSPSSPAGPLAGSLWTGGSSALCLRQARSSSSRSA